MDWSWYQDTSVCQSIRHKIFDMTCGGLWWDTNISHAMYLPSSIILQELMRNMAICCVSLNQDKLEFNIEQSQFYIMQMQCRQNCYQFTLKHEVQTCQVGSYCEDRTDIHHLQRFEILMPCLLLLLRKNIKGTMLNF